MAPLTDTKYCSGVGRGGLRGAEAPPPEMCEGGPCHGCGEFVG